MLKNVSNAQSFLRLIAGAVRGLFVKWHGGGSYPEELKTTLKKLVFAENLLQVTIIEAAF